jgi:ligand-binding SRPBCC domain-containing protein
MHVYTLECEMLAPVAIQDAFSVFESPYNLARITPPWLGFRILNDQRVVMRKGAEIDYSIGWMGLPMKWMTRITEYEPPFVFVDEQKRGPYALWRHTHTFQPCEAGTIVGDRVEYALPLGPLGRIAHAVIVRRQLEGIFRYRQERLSEIFYEMTERPAHHTS